MANSEVQLSGEELNKQLGTADLSVDTLATVTSLSLDSLVKSSLSFVNSSTDKSFYFYMSDDPISLEQPEQNPPALSPVCTSSWLSTGVGFVCNSKSASYSTGGTGITSQIPHFPPDS